MGNNFEILVRFNSILGHKNGLKRRVPHGRYSKIYYFEENWNLSTTLP